MMYAHLQLNRLFWAAIDKFAKEFRQRRLNCARFTVINYTNDFLTMSGSEPVRRPVSLENRAFYHRWDPLEPKATKDVRFPG